MASSLVRYPGPGCVVEFMHGNKPQVAWVLEEQSGKLRLFTLNKREMKLATARILPWAGPQYSGEHSRQQMGDILDEHHRRRESREAEIAALELWELAQGEVDKASVEWFAELLWAQPHVDDVAALGHALLACKTHFRFQPPDFEIYSAERVESRMVEERKREEREMLVTAGQEFFQSLWEASSRGKALGRQPEGELRERLRDVILGRMADPDNHDIEQVWKLLAKGLPEDPHMPLRLAQAWGLVPPHHNFWLDRAGYDCTDAWAEPHADEVETLQRRVRDLCAEPDGYPYISIDSASTRDIDDAFAIARRDDGGWHLRLAIACPALEWPFGGPLDREVMRRATSVYLPEGNGNMLPTALGTDFFSLVGGEVRPAMVLDMELSAEGETERCEPSMQWVRLACNLTYVDCESVIAGGGEGTPAAAHREQILCAMELADVLIARRVRNGAVIIDRNDPKVVLTGEGADLRVDILDSEEVPRSMLLVSEMMILANSGLALWARERDVALLHRTQDVAVPKEYAGIWSEPQDIARVVKSLSSALLEPGPKPHRGIGVEAYSPVTSPLRRYPDLVNVAQVLHYVREGAPLWTREALAAMLPVLGARLDAVGQIQRFRPRYWKLLYFRQRGDKVWWDAVVTEDNDMFVTVSLPREQIFVRGRRKSFGDKVYPGQRLQVRLGKVHPLENEIQILDVMEEE